MIKVNWKILFKRLGILLLFIILILSIQKYINHQISVGVQLSQEICEKQKADIQIKLEQKRLEEKTKLEKDIVELRIQLEKAKILLDKIQQQKTYSTMIKKDVKKFMAEFDSIFSVEGKK